MKTVLKEVVQDFNRFRGELNPTINDMLNHVLSEPPIIRLYLNKDLITLDVDALVVAMS